MVKIVNDTQERHRVFWKMVMSLKLVSGFCLIFMSIFVSGSYAQVQELSAPTPVASSYFGWSSATDGQTLVVGAPYENSSLGAAYVYENNGLDWDYVATLDPNFVIPQASPLFGYAVDVDGDTIVVGAYRYDHDVTDNVGAIFIYEKDINGSWEVEPLKVTVDSAQESLLFGISVSIDGDTIAVGATFDDDEKGAVYVYERSGSVWPLAQKLTASDGEGTGGGQRSWGDWLGLDVAVDGDIIVAGARQDKIGDNERQGSAYVFMKSGSDWADSVTKLENATGSAIDYFGCAVDVSGHVVVIGAYREVKGKVYVYRYDDAQWELEQQLPQEPAYSTQYSDPSQDFGFGVAIDGDRLVVGAPRLSGGYVFMFEWNDTFWSDALELIPDGGEGYLGRSVAIAGDFAFAGAPYKDDLLDDIGAVYAVSLPAKVFNEFQVNTYIDNNQKKPAIAFNADGDFVVVWQSELQDSDRMGIYGQKYDQYGIRVGDEFRVNQSVAYSQFSPDVCFLPDSSFVVAWAGHDATFNADIYIRKFDANCDPVTGDVLVNTYVDNGQGSVMVACSGNNTMVAWESWVGPGAHTGDEYAKIRTYNSSLVPLSSEITVSAAAGYRPETKPDGQGNFIVFWTETVVVGTSSIACMQTYNASGQPLDSKQTFAVGREHSFDMYPSGGYLFTWEEDGASDASLIKAQKYSAAGTKIGSEIIVTDLYMRKDSAKAGVLSNDHFVVTWGGNVNSTDTNIYTREFDENGIAIGPEEIVNSYLPNNQYGPRIAAGLDGKYLITWYGDGQDGSGDGVSAAFGPATYLGDFNLDRRISLSDLQILAEGWLNDEPVLDVAPEGGDGVVNLFDFSVLFKNWLYGFSDADFVAPSGVNYLDFAFFANHWSDSDCQTSNNCDRTDLDRSGQVDIADLVLFAGDWLWR